MNDPGELILFQTEDGQTRIDVRLVGETVWLSAGQISELFQRDKSTISRNIQNVYDEGELKPEGTVELFATVQKAGDREVIRDIEHYSLDVIITAEAARVLAEQEYERYCCTLDTQPSPVEVHFDEAVKKAKQWAQPKKKGNKTEGRK